LKPIEPHIPELMAQRVVEQADSACRLGRCSDDLVFEQDDIEVVVEAQVKRSAVDIPPPINSIFFAIYPSPFA
jgi:hypothetical protein